MKLSLRPFGECAEDLEIDFLRSHRPYLEAKILECCLQNREEIDRDCAFLWNLEIGKRTEYLLTLATLNRASQIEVNLHCSNSECQKQMEVQLSLSDLVLLQQQSDNKTIEVELGDRTFEFRKPTGSDQKSWLELHFVDERSAILAMMQTLLAPEQKSLFQNAICQERDWEKMLNRVMEEGDPLVNFVLEVTCPYCNTQNLQDFDLGAWALQQLYVMQQQLLFTIHRLATYYHWSESAIFAIPPWRRSRYLALIEREENYR